MAEPRGSLLEAAPPEDPEEGGVATPPSVGPWKGGALPVKRLRGPAAGVEVATSAPRWRPAGLSGTEVRPSGLVRPETAFWSSHPRARGEVAGKFPCRLGCALLH